MKKNDKMLQRMIFILREICYSFDGWIAYSSREKEYGIIPMVGFIERSYTDSNVREICYEKAINDITIVIVFMFLQQ